MSTPFIQLPNGDLWRGYIRSEKGTDNVQAPVTEDTKISKIDQAMNELVKNAKGASMLSCTWCGHQTVEKNMRAHLTKNHPSVFNPLTDEAILFGNVDKDVVDNVDNKG